MSDGPPTGETSITTFRTGRLTRLRQNGAVLTHNATAVMRSQAKALGAEAVFDKSTEIQVSSTG